MFTISTIIAIGPSLITAASVIALLIVHRSLSRVPHALIWAASFAVSAVRWGLVAIADLAGLDGLSGSVVFNLLGMVSILLFADGFRVRSGRAGLAWVIPFAAVVSFVLVLAVHALPPTQLRLALVPMASIVLLSWAATLITPPGSERSLAEVAVVATLCTLALVHLAGVALALGEHTGLIHSRGAFVRLYAATLSPASAATGLFALLLIAFDSSARLQRVIRTDPLTGVLNRLGFEEVATAAIRRAERRRRVLSLAMADIDAFKGINDRYGHAAGDAALVGFAEHLARSMTRGEVVGRIGGEEFAMLLPGIDGQTSLARIEAVRVGLAGLRHGGTPDLALTASFGVAERGPDETLESLTLRADEALYRSKREGRDRATLAPPAVSA